MLLLTAALVGCAPPPYDTGDGRPSIALLWPPAESAAAGCVSVAVDIQNFKVVDPADVSGEHVDGQGHYHVITPVGHDTCYHPVCLSDYTSLSADTQGELRVVMVDDGHQPVLDENDDPYEAAILFTFLAGTVCEGGEVVEDGGTE